MTSSLDIPSKENLKCEILPEEFTQYDLLVSDKIYFPDMARSQTLKELRNFNRRIKK